MSRRKTVDRQALFQTPRAAAEITGLSYKAVLSGCKNGKIPCRREGAVFLVYMPGFLKKLEHECSASVSEGVAV